MSEREKYADIYGQAPRVTAEDRAAVAEIWQGVWGDDRPYEVAPTNFITWDELRRFPAELRVGAGARLLDLGCGGGGPGLWVADRTGARLTGIDCSPEGCAAAGRRAATRYGQVAAEYRVADMAATGLPDAFFDAAMSIDALQLVPDRLAAFRECARVLRPSARLVLTSWDHPGDVPREALLPGRELVPDSRPLLEAAGFRVVAYDRIASWDERAVATYRAMLERRAVVGAVAGAEVIREAEWGAVHARRSVHVFIVGERAEAGA